MGGVQTSNLYAKSTEIKNPVYGSEEIDVSHWQGSINWSTVAQSKKFALMKIGGRVDTDRSSWRDWLRKYRKQELENARREKLLLFWHYYI